MKKIDPMLLNNEDSIKYSKIWKNIKTFVASDHVELLSLEDIDNAIKYVVDKIFNLCNEFDDTASGLLKYRYLTEYYSQQGRTFSDIMLLPVAELGSENQGMVIHTCSTTKDAESLLPVIAERITSGINGVDLSTATFEIKNDKVIISQDSFPKYVIHIVERIKTF